VDVLRASAPVISLDGTILRQNVKTWKARTHANVRAVVKANGYGFGLECLVRELDGTADGFVVSDAEGLQRLRTITNAPAATLLDLGTEHAQRVVALGGIANVAHRESLAALAARADAASLVVRVGLRLAAGWSAIEMRDAATFATTLAQAGMQVELWTHLTNPVTEHADRERFARFIAIFRQRGVDIVGEDFESTAPAANDRVHGTSVRIGVGLFGTSGLPCAIGVQAPIIDWLRSDGTLRASYDADALPEGTHVLVVRCGYSDGFPRVARPYRRVLSVGMQNCVVLGRDETTNVSLLRADDDLDDLANAAGILSHQIVTGLGLAFQRQER
jgi:alanine racemase